MRKTFAIAVLAMLAWHASLHGQANVVFGGGNGAPLTITILQPIRYVTTATTISPGGPGFTIQGVGNFLFLDAPFVTGDVGFSINGFSSGQNIFRISNGIRAGDVGPNELNLSGSFLPPVMGDVVTLSAGTITTTISMAGPPPANGAYQTILVDGYGRIISAPGAAIPEPSTGMLLAAGTMAMSGLALQLQRRRESA